jgi:hypothetical protein
MKGIHGIRTVEQARRSARLRADIQEVLRMEREKQNGGRPHNDGPRPPPGLVSVGAVFDQALANGRARRL